MEKNETPSTSRLLRSKRTRNASADSDSLKLPATKKRRSALRRDTFEPLTESSLNERAGRTQPSSEDVKSDDSVKSVQKTSTNAQIHELTLRGGRRHEKRSERGLGLLTLATNAQYTVSQLPALPEQIRSRPNIPYACVISPENDYILALTHSDALIWPYNSSSAKPSARELISFKLPFPPSMSDDPLPLAAFTSKAANGEPGLVVVSPKWGKVVCWETLSSATAYSPTESAAGVQGTIPGMFHGEVVKELVPAEPAGFILSLASGRVAHLTVKDQVGRPAIGLQFMRKSSAGNTKGGIFGSIRNVLVGDRRKGTPFVRAGLVARSQREVIIGSEDAEIEFWTNNLLTGNQLIHTVDLKDRIRAALETQDANQPQHIKLVDFALVGTPATNEIVRQGDSPLAHLTLLVAISTDNKTEYSIVEATVSNDQAHIRVVQPIRCYSDAGSTEPDFTPRLCIPPSSTTAFVLFSQAVVIASLAKIAESPSSQLLGEKDELPRPFQDVVQFKKDNVYKLINYAAEDHESQTSCVIAVQGFGIIRITSHLPHDIEIEADQVISKVDARARLEEAIFFGTKSSNPLDLRRSHRDVYNRQELRQAILEISRSILLSTSKHISRTASAITDQLQQRTRAMQDLIEYAQKMYPDCIDRADRVVMLGQAERVAAAQAIWKVQERIQSTYPRDDDRMGSYMEFTLLAMSEKRQDYPKVEKGESDHVRHWLVRSTKSIDHFLVELQDAIKELPELHFTDPQLMCDYFLEGMELWTAAIDAGFRFRENNLTVYGLGNEPYENGIHMVGYPLEMPRQWTSTDEQIAHGQEYIREMCQFLQDWWNYHSPTSSKSKRLKKELPQTIDGESYAPPKQEHLQLIADKLPRQVELANRMALEGNIQLRFYVAASVKDDVRMEQQMDELKQEILLRKRINIRNFSPFNWHAAIQLAEAEKDTELLITLNQAYLANLSKRAMDHPESIDDVNKTIRKVQDHVQTYFDKFGNAWAYSQFSDMIEKGELGKLIDASESVKKQPYVTWFFDECAKDGHHVGKIAWINNIIGEKKYDAASHMLDTVAQTEESDLWSKKTELCLAKLAGLAALEGGSATNTLRLDHFKNELDYLHIVETVATHINTDIGLGFVDDQAAIEEAVQKYLSNDTTSGGKATMHQRGTLTTVLRKLVTNQTVDVVELVDALTLLKFNSLHPDDAGDDIHGSEFPYALRAIDLASPKEASNPEKDALRKTVWRRLLIKDNWEALNKTQGKSDSRVQLEMQHTVLYLTLIEITQRAEDHGVEVPIPSVDDLLAKVDKPADDVKEELAKLKKFVDKCRLKDHFNALIQEARKEVRELQDKRGEAQAEDVFAGNVPILTNGHGRVNGDLS